LIFMQVERPKESRTVDELADVLQLDRVQMSGCPESVLKVFAYGMPWKVLLIFGAEAGPVRHRPELQRYRSARRAPATQKCQVRCAG
jgi:hypothetical protein